MDLDHYILTLGKLKDATQKKFPHLSVGLFMVTHKFLLHYNNAPCHVSLPTLAKLDEWHIEMSHTHLIHPTWPHEAFQEVVQRRC